jgi:hypothetical protein
MNQSWLRFALVFLACLPSAGCELVGDIFKAGVWVGVIGVFAVVALIVWLFAKAKG